MRDLLAHIHSERFLTEIGYHLPHRAMRNHLMGIEECRELRLAYLTGSLSEKMIRDYVQELMSLWCKGERFSYDLTLAVICVALEPLSTDFAREYITDLSKLKLGELPLSIGIAKLSVQARQKMTANIYRSFVQNEDIETMFYQGSETRVSGSITFVEVEYETV